MDRASEIRVPVALLQHSEDRRVDIDRDYRMLNATRGLPEAAVAHVIQGAGYSPDRDPMIDFMLRLEKFRTTHLQPS